MRSHGPSVSLSLGRFLALLALFPALLSALPRDSSQGQPLLHTVPFKAGDAGAKIYRIPAIGWSSGATLLAFAERRMEQRRMAGDIDVVLRRSHNLGQTWEPVQVIANLGRDACGNPCMVQDESNGRLWLAFTRSRNQDTEEEIVASTVPGTQVWITHSNDDGTTWASPRNISPTARKASWGWYGTGPGSGLFLRGRAARPDRLLIPSYHTEDGTYRAHSLYSDDHGETWLVGNDVHDHTSEPQVIEMDSDTLLMNARSVAGHRNHRTLMASRDRGTTWQSAEGMAAMVENKCQGCIHRVPRPGLAGDHDWVFSHPISPNRAGVHAWISSDGGRTWPGARMLWSGPSAYTAMVRLPNGLVGMLVECGVKDPYEQIAFLTFAPEWLKTGTAPDIRPLTK